MEIEVDIISGDAITHAFMEAADLFSDRKQLGTYECMVVTGNEKVMLDKLVENLRMGLEKAGRNVSFISIRSIDGKKNYKYPAYIRPGVNEISTGQKWGLFEEWLKQLGYEVETDEFRKVTKAYFWKKHFTIT